MGHKSHLPYNTASSSFAIQYYYLGSSALQYDIRLVCLTIRHQARLLYNTTFQARLPYNTIFQAGLPYNTTFQAHPPYNTTFQARPPYNTTFRFVRLTIRYSGSSTLQYDIRIIHLTIKHFPLYYYISIYYQNYSRLTSSFGDRSQFFKKLSQIVTTREHPLVVTGVLDLEEV
ncbi:hypothetical protein KY290_007758 [Solanum tuberosum]|uniref:Uncharacterized protein n=1 Tax=Solanum tuberosum TaxID=4113 RepID=A0ABQ7W6G7_SOLTU|nr:hypothetical protein KY290_007758 [Solanum tuberosum]